MLDRFRPLGTLWLQMLVTWSNDREVVVYGRAEALDEHVTTAEGFAAAVLYLVPRAWYTGAFLEMYDLLYGPRAPINAMFPQLRLRVDSVLQDGSSIAIFGEHRLWEEGEPSFDGSVFLHMPRFFELKTNGLELQLQAANLIYKNRDRLPWRT